MQKLTSLPTSYLTNVSCSESANALGVSSYDRLFLNDGVSCQASVFFTNQSSRVPLSKYDVNLVNVSSLTFPFEVAYDASSLLYGRACKLISEMSVVFVDMCEV